MDSEVLKQVIEDMRKREAKGLETYGTTMDRQDLTAAQWICHMKEELMDAILYLQKLENINNNKVY
jgi:hypothetical protein